MNTAPNRPAWATDTSDPDDALGIPRGWHHDVGEVFGTDLSGERVGVRICAVESEDPSPGIYVPQLDGRTATHAREVARRLAAAHPERMSRRRC